MSLCFFLLQRSLLRVPQTQCAPWEVCLSWDSAKRANAWHERVAGCVFTATSNTHLQGYFLELNSELGFMQSPMFSLLKVAVYLEPYFGGDIEWNKKTWAILS